MRKIINIKKRQYMKRLMQNNFSRNVYTNPNIFYTREDVYSKKWIYSYEEIWSSINDLAKNSNYLLKEMPSIGTSSFGYPIRYYTLGNGEKDVIFTAVTHGNEIVTATYIIHFLEHVLGDKGNKYSDYLKNYTFHIIPVLNPEGYIISSSMVLNNTQGMSNKEIEALAAKFQKAYMEDDENASKSIKAEKLYKKVLKSSTEFIPNLNLRKSVEQILKNTKLDSSVLPIWSTNGNGIDLNGNSIHEFENKKKLMNNQKFGLMRYNDIPVTIPSPHGFPGDEIFDKRVPENSLLYNFVNKIYRKGKLKLFISYHSTGAIIFGYPDQNLTSKAQYDLIVKGMECYKKYTNYGLINEKYKYGVMDYYRIALIGTVSLTVELSRINGNPLGPFSNLTNLNNEFNDNFKAVFYTLPCILG